MVLIGAARRVEHYEIAAYQTAIKMAETMSNEQAADLLRETLSEEEETDGKLEDMCDELLETIGAGDMGEEGEERPAATGSAKTRRAG